MLSLPQLDPVDAKAVLLVFYNETYGLVNQSEFTAPGPLDIVSMHPEMEDINKYSLLEESLTAYAKSGVMSVFGLNVEEFMNYPSNVCEILMRVASASIAKKSSVVDDVVKDLQNIK